MTPNHQSRPIPSDTLLAGWFVAVPERVTGGNLPPTERLTTASACLIDQLPEDDSWFATAEEARAACALLPIPAAARLYALLIPADHTAGFVADIRTSGMHEPALLSCLDENRSEPALQPTEGGTELGWEVIGYDMGWVHTWLCNDLYSDAVRELGVRTDDRGLLPDRHPAERLAAWANARNDTKPVTWVPARLVEWDTPLHGLPAPAAGARNVPASPSRLRGLVRRSAELGTAGPP
ncbi:hypothetical protein [Kitasatospora sp. CB02891]|uniref:hypothetical protein n=1 Tax=Kitasatospora sp. CB02891 TaxID=2020329 RepID=UPI000C276D0D|nr:hypothetical protein [Kitasatospora sp. CB02891]PJN29179.1 hypothetical protein CG736_01000 [Kitasatospora sp. CB02891]